MALEMLDEKTDQQESILSEVDRLGYYVISGPALRDRVASRCALSRAEYLVAVPPRCIYRARTKDAQDQDTDECEATVTDISLLAQLALKVNELSSQLSLVLEHVKDLQAQQTTLLSETQPKRPCAEGSTSRKLTFKEFLGAMWW